MGIFAKFLLFIMAFFLVSTNALYAQNLLSTLSTNKDHKLEEQQISVSSQNNSLVLSINWKKTNPIIFSKKKKQIYLDFFDKTISQWNRYVKETKASGKHIYKLPYLPTYRGEVGFLFFRHVTFGQKVFDNSPRLQLVYCERRDSSCIRTQVHFYTKKQVTQIRELIFKQL